MDLSGAALLGGFHDPVNVWHIKIHDPVASGTDKMMMPGSVAIKAVSPSVGGDLHDLPEIRKKGQIPVNSSQTDVWKFFPDIHIDGIGSGMVRPGGQECLDTLSLFASFQISHSISPSANAPAQRRSLYYNRRKTFAPWREVIYNNDNSY